MPWLQGFASRERLGASSSACRSVPPRLDLGCDCPCSTFSQVQMVSTEGTAFPLSLRRCRGLQIPGERGEGWRKGIPMGF